MKKYIENSSVNQEYWKQNAVRGEGKNRKVSFNLGNV